MPLLLFDWKRVAANAMLCLLYRSIENRFCWQFFLHLIAHLVSNLCQGSLVIAGLVVEDDAKRSDRFVGSVEKNQLVFKVLACRVQFQVAFAGANTTQVVFIADLSDTAEVRSHNQILMPRRLRMDSDQDNLWMLCQCVFYQFLSVGGWLCIGRVHLLWIYLAHASDGLLTYLLCRTGDCVRETQDHCNEEYCCCFHTSPGL